MDPRRVFGILLFFFQVLTMATDKKIVNGTGCLETILRFGFTYVACNFKEKDYFGYICSTNSECKKPNTTCSQTGEVGTCVCKDGFIRVDDSCKKAFDILVESLGLPFPLENEEEQTLPANQKSRIPKGKHAAKPVKHHSATNPASPGEPQQKSGSVSTSTEVSTLDISVKDENRLVLPSTTFSVTTTSIVATPSSNGPDVNLESANHVDTTGKMLHVTEETHNITILLVGVGVGSFILGVALSLSIVFIVRKCRIQGNQNNDLRSNADNPTYNKYIEGGESSRRRNMPDKVSTMPIADKNTAYSEVKILSDNTGDIYNHLHEQVTHDTAGLDSDYDHAKPLKDQLSPDREYSHLTSKIEDFKSNQDVQQSAEMEENADENNDNYFTLEKIN